MSNISPKLTRFYFCILNIASFLGPHNDVQSKTWKGPVVIGGCCIYIRPRGEMKYVNSISHQVQSFHPSSQWHCGPLCD